MVATKYVKQFGEEVEKLILINPIGLEDYLKYVEYKDTNFFYKNELKKTKDSIKNYQLKAYYDGKWKSAYNELIEPSISQLKSSDYKTVAWANAATYNMIFSEQIVSDFSNIYKPTTLIIGTRDRTAPGRNWKKKSFAKFKLGQYQVLGKEIAKKFRYGKLVELKGIGHMPFYEDPSKFKTVFTKEI